MAHSHEYDCRICGAHLDSQKELDQHNKDKHAQQASSSQQGQQPNARQSNNRDADLG